MTNELDIIHDLHEDSWRFYPSHLTKALLCSALSFGFAVYATREFRRVEKEELIALVFGP